MSRLGARLSRWIGSARLAAWLIALLVAFLLVSFVVPQRGIFSDEQVEAFLGDLPYAIQWPVRTLSFDHVFTSAVFFVVAGLLVVNLAVCTARRALRRMRRAGSRSLGNIPDTARLVVTSDASAVRIALLARGARETHASDAATDGRVNERSGYYLGRGTVGFIGSIVMHAAMILAVAGGIVTGLTLFRGEMVLTEGQTLNDSPSSYVQLARVPSAGAAFREFAVTLDKMRFVYESGKVVDAVADMRVEDGRGSRTADVRVNYPLKEQGKSFLLKDGGHSVSITVTRADGTAVVDSLVNLLTVSRSGYADSLEIDGQTLYMLSRPDAGVPLTRPIKNGLKLVSPFVGLTLERPKTTSDYTWVVPGAPAIRMGEYTVAVNEVRLWNRFMVRADGGRYAVYVAFALIIVGAILRFLDPDRWVRAAIIEQGSEARVYVWGSSRYRAQGMPAEGERLIATLVGNGGRVVDDS